MVSTTSRYAEKFIFLIFGGIAFSSGRKDHDQLRTFFQALFPHLRYFPFRARPAGLSKNFKFTETDSRGIEPGRVCRRQSFALEF